jgi:hypothetical protein
MTPNDEALARFAAGDALLRAVVSAREAIPPLGDGWTLSHAGPPLPYRSMCGAMQGALQGAMVYEGWAGSPAEAHARLQAGQVRLLSNHEHGAVAPMAGVISPSMLAFVVENPRYGNRVATIGNEGIQRDVLRCGANGPGVIARLRHLNDVVMPAIGAALPEQLSLREMMATAILMGDEVHQRNVAGTALLLRALLPQIGVAPRESALIAHLSETGQFFLNLAMAAAKALLDPLSGIPGCTIVTAISRNGVEVGIRVSATGNRWFRAPAPLPRGVYWPPFSEADANPDIGDSAIVETAGLGGAVLPNSPAVQPVVGCAGPEEARQLQDEVYRITAGQSPFFICSPAEGRGSPFGIDVVKVAATGITPVITTGIAHRQAGGGMVGAGIVRPPLAPFVEAAGAIAGVLAQEVA